MRLRDTVVSLLLVAPTWGCVATFASLPETPPAPGQGLSIQVSAARVKYLELRPGSWKEWSEGDTTSSVWALERSGWFREVGPLVWPYDYRTEIMVREYQGFTYGGLLHLVTAFILPVNRMHRVAVEATVASAAGGESHCKADQDYAVWQSVLLLPIYPFRSPAWHEHRLVEQLTLRCIAESLRELGAVR
jgi:hypothetical protein